MTATADDSAYSEHGLRLRMVTAGVAISFAAVAVLMAWSIATWDHPNRSLMVGLLVAAAAIAFVVARFRRRRSSAAGTARPSSSPGASRTWR